MSNSESLKRTCDALCVFIVAMGDKLVAQSTALSAAPPKLKEALRLNTELTHDNAKLLHIVTKLARKDFAGAELAAMKLVSGTSED